MRTAAMAAGVILLAAACSSGGGDPTPTPSAPATGTPSPSPRPTPRGMQADDYWFLGMITDIRDIRPVDGPLIVTVEVTEHLDGIVVQAGETFDIVQGGGRSPYRCYGQLPDSLRIGAEVFAFAHADTRDVADLSTCDDERYFVVLTPAAAAAPTPPPTCPPGEPSCPLESAPGEPTSPPYPTCRVDHCLPLPRTVTIDLWSCDGGPCEASEEFNCQRSVSLQVGNESYEPHPFFCTVQFFAAPPGDYLVVVARRVACGPDCDALERCHVMASANRIAIEPVADGKCPVHMIR